MKTSGKLPLFNIVYLLSFMEGGALMAIELIGAKIIAPYYGNSLYVWTAVLATTLGGLATGYFSGGLISGKWNKMKTIYFILFISALIVALIPVSAPTVMEATLGLELKSGITLSCLFILTPPLICFGMVSPVIISYLSTELSLVGRAAGTVYGISTIGGILFTFLMGIYLIPNAGLKISTWLTAIVLGLFPVIYFIRSIFLSKCRKPI